VDNGDSGWFGAGLEVRRGPEFVDTTTTHGEIVEPPTAAPPSLDKLEEMVGQDAAVDQVCAELARLLGVRTDEVAILGLKKAALRFLFPPGLRAVGSIPLSSPAVAARTAVTMMPMISNTFAKTRHVRVFEKFKLGVPEAQGISEAIQKMISAPIQHENEPVLGVIEVSRKGVDLSSAGPDFTSSDLRLLVAAAAIVARMRFMRQSQEEEATPKDSKPT
jgi:hypothetical protein